MSNCGGGDIIEDKVRLTGASREGVLGAYSAPNAGGSLLGMVHRHLASSVTKFSRASPEELKGTGLPSKYLHFRANILQGLVPAKEIWDWLSIHGKTKDASTPVSHCIEPPTGLLQRCNFFCT